MKQLRQSNVTECFLPEPSLSDGKKPKNARFCLAFFYFQERPSALKKQNFKIWLQKAKFETL